MTATKQVLAEKFCFASSIEESVWHPKQDANGYEWFYFDGLSDDGRDALIVTFFDNFVHSPRYNSGKHAQKIPALMFCYYRNGKPLYRAINEFSDADLIYSADEKLCKLSENSFKFDSAPYGKGYILEINTTFHQNKRLEAKLEWLFIESDFQPQTTENITDSHLFNLVSPRADVTGHIKVTGKNGKLLDLVHFRGTGCHEQQFDSRRMCETFTDFQWGRAHFADATAVFVQSQETGVTKAITKLYVVRDGELRQRNAEFEAQGFSRNSFGLKYPNRLRFVSEDNMRLRIKQTEIIDSSFFYLRFLSEFTLTLRDGTPRKTVGITEYLAPNKLKYRWLDWLIDLRIGKNGKSAFLA